MLILCEKPSAARDFAGALGCTARKGFYSRGETVITWCLGHLFELCKPEAYNPAYKTWDTALLPIIPEAFRYEKIHRAAEQAGMVISLLKKHSTDTIIIATDAGREGELIARTVLAQAGVVDISRIKRFWVSEALTATVVKNGLAAAMSLEDYNLIARQGYARQRADWLIGINLTRYMSAGKNELFSVGRVQTAVLQAVRLRNREAAEFKPAPYQELEAAVDAGGGCGIKARLVNPVSGKTAFETADPYLEIAHAFCRNRPLETVSVHSVQKTEKPEKLYNITGLQKEAYRRYGYTPEKTLEAAQTLYEKYKCLSYPRTPSRVMGDQNVELFLEKYNILSKAYPDYARHTVPALIVPGNRHVFDTSRLEDHHALIPLAPLPQGAAGVERAIYTLVLESFFRVCMPDYIYTEKSLTFGAEEYRFTARVRETVQRGWKQSGNGSEDGGGDQEQEVSDFNESGAILVSSKIVNKESTPPKEFSIDSLLAFMENPRGRPGEKLAGLGTAATRSSIISLLFERGYLEDKKKKLYVKEKGIRLLDALSKGGRLQEITEVVTTTAWEKQLQENPEQFEQSVIEYLKSCIKPGERTSPEKKTQPGKSGQSIEKGGR